MKNYEDLIGKNIKEVRLSRGLSQEVLSDMCGFSNTTLSAYENGRKIPSLTTIARIAQGLNVSIERLYYGDENNAFIIAEPDAGKRIVNSIYYLWSAGIISYYENYCYGMDPYDYGQSKAPMGVYIYLKKFDSQIKRLILSLNEFESKKDTYSDQDKYLEFLLSSVATEINNEIEHDRAQLEKKEEPVKRLAGTQKP